MSFITDSCRSKHGRRRPFIMTGCVPYGVFLFLLCSPPSGLSSWNTSNWFGCFYILYYIMNTYSNIPYDALGPELTDNYEDRSRLFFISGLFDGFGTILTVTTPVGLQLMLGTLNIFFNNKEIKNENEKRASVQLECNSFFLFFYFLFLLCATWFLIRASFH